MPIQADSGPRAQGMSGGTGSCHSWSLSATQRANRRCSRLVLSPSRRTFCTAHVRLKSGVWAIIMCHLNSYMSDLSSYCMSSFYSGRPQYIQKSMVDSNIQSMTVTLQTFSECSCQGLHPLKLCYTAAAIKAESIDSRRASIACAEHSCDSPVKSFT